MPTVIGKLVVWYTAPEIEVAGKCMDVEAEMDELEKPLAIIPARAGSKRIPRKNIRAINGVPLLAHTLRKLVSIGIFSKVYVSTDSEDVARVARNAGGNVPFLREKNLSDDMTGTHPVVANFLGKLPPEEVDPDRLVCCIYPAAFLLENSDLIDSLAIASSLPGAAVIGATRYPHPPQRAFSRDKDGFGHYVEPENKLLRTQDLEPRYFDAGQFYWGQVASWLQTEGASIRRFLFELPRHRAVDLDEEEDWIIAESLFVKKRDESLS